MSEREELDHLADALAFLGNSLLSPVNQTGAIGLSAAFWRAFPDVGSAEVSRAIQALIDSAYEGGPTETEILHEATCQTSLFIGPPKPLAPPWETFYSHDDMHVGFGKATFEMRRLLAEHGLKLENENNQYEDHIGVELLYLSHLCRWAKTQDDFDEMQAFVRVHPILWIDDLKALVETSFPQCYTARLLEVTKCLLLVLVEHDERYVQSPL